MGAFSFLEYCTIYRVTGKINRELTKQACFYDVFLQDHNNGNTYSIILIKNDEYLNLQFSNACFFNKQEIRNHLKIAKRLYKFNYIVTDTEYKGHAAFLIKLHLDNVPELFHKYILTWVRYTYEYPYNVILKDAYTLKKDALFRFESIANIFNCILGIYPQDDYPRTIHQIIRKNSELLTNKSLQLKISISEDLHSIYREIKPISEFPRNFGELDVYDIEYWKEGFEMRKPYYIDNYKYLKKCVKFM